TDGGLLRLYLGGGAEAAEAVGGPDPGVIGQQIGQPARGGVLVGGQGVGVLPAEQVRPAGGAVQQGAAGEHPDRSPVAVDVLVQHVRQVVEGVPGGGQHP